MKILAVGMNYALHNKELGHTEENREPVLFLKPDSSLLKNGLPFFLPDFSNDIQYEAEVVVHICRLGKNIAPEFACRYYDSVTVGIDFTARDLQKKARELGHPWFISKGFDESAAIGTFIPLEELGNDVQNIDFHLNIDGKTVQHGHTSDMLFKVDEIIAYASKYMTMKIGDLLFTGTPAGVGRIGVDQHLEGYLNQEKVLDFYIR